MSIATEIARISKNVSDSLDAVADKGVVVPAGSNSDDLPELISLILSGSGSVISIVDELDSHGGTIRHINAVSLEGDTVSANTLLSGYTAHNRLGDPIVGTYVPPSTPALDVKTITVNDTYNASDDNLDGYSLIIVNVPQQATLQDKTVTPTESLQTITKDSGYDGLGTITVNAISSTYVGSGIDRNDSSDLTTSGATVNVPSGYYESNASKTISSGTAGTPTATKGTVSNHSISITPSVTNTTGYITGSTKTGTAVTVSASELVSGSETKTENGTYDVTNLASLVVNVSGSAGKNIQMALGPASIRNNGYTTTGLTITVAKSGTYDISWSAWRSSSSGTMGTRLRKNTTDGTAQQTWTNTYGQHISMTNQSLSSGDILTLYATSGSNSRYINVVDFIISEV